MIMGIQGWVNAQCLVDKLHSWLSLVVVKKSSQLALTTCFKNCIQSNLGGKEDERSHSHIQKIKDYHWCTPSLTPSTLTPAHPCGRVHVVINQKHLSTFSAFLNSKQKRQHKVSVSSTSPRKHKLCNRL